MPKYNRLTFVKFTSNNRFGAKTALWKCDCGTVKRIIHNHVVRGITKSCGCLQREALANTVVKFRRHAPGDACFNSLYQLYAAGAKRRSHVFAITRDQFKNLTKSNCYYCGTTPNSILRRKTCYGHYVYNGIDRIDNTKGYVPKNVVACCADCNRAKRAMDQKTFFAWIIRVHDNLGSIGVLAKLKHPPTTSEKGPHGVPISP